MDVLLNPFSFFGRNNEERREGEEEEKKGDEPPSSYVLAGFALEFDLN